mmetsp:Transcript_81857/g.95581  ORF Transcript_81857/g.95581 Transcript_81857/m.95581 type:complete len:301 (+) Transcript_81857:3032-3934(+)
MLCDLRLPRGVHVGEDIWDGPVVNILEAAVKVLCRRVSVGQYETVAYGQHSQATHVRRRVKHDGRESNRRLGIQGHHDSSLHTSLSVGENLLEALSAENCLAVVRNQLCQKRVPLCGDVLEGAAADHHDTPTNSVFDGFNICRGHLNKRSSRHVTSCLTVQRPGALGLNDLLVGAAHRQNSYGKATKVEKEIAVVGGVDTSTACVFPNVNQRRRKPALEVPQYGTGDVDISEEQVHTAVAGPLFEILESVDSSVQLGGIRVILSGLPIPLAEFIRLSFGEPQKNMGNILVARVAPNRMCS